MSLLEILDSNKLVLISKSACPNCVKLKAFFNEKQISYLTVSIEEYLEDTDDDDKVFGEIDFLKKTWEITSYPMTFINGKYIGNYNHILNMNTFGQLDSILEQANINFETIDSF